MAWGNQYGYGQPVMQQPQMTTFINVPSEEVAYKWRVDPNTSVNFINENEGFVYRKSVGMSILEPFLFEVYRLEKVGDNNPKNEEQAQSAPNIDLSDYITKSEFEAYKQTIDEMKKFVEELKG